jgi:hypothetical protein
MAGIIIKDRAAVLARVVDDMTTRCLSDPALNR